MALTAKLPCDLSKGRICELPGKKHGNRPRQCYYSRPAVERYLLQRHIEEVCDRDLYLFDGDLHDWLCKSIRRYRRRKTHQVITAASVTYPYLS
jgi:hypothetical protein